MEAVARVRVVVALAEQSKPSGQEAQRRAPFSSVALVGYTGAAVAAEPRAQLWYSTVNQLRLRSAEVPHDWNHD